jgi:hypothetical protein
VTNDTPPVRQRKEPDVWASTANQESVLPARFVSSSTVDEGEGLRIEVMRFDLVADKFADADEEPRKFGEITGDVLESRADRFTDGQEVVLTCRSVRLEQLANEHPGPGDTVTLIHGGFLGKVVDWKYSIQRAGEVTPA